MEQAGLALDFGCVHAYWFEDGSQGDLLLLFGRRLGHCRKMVKQGHQAAVRVMTTKRCALGYFKAWAHFNDWQRVVISKKHMWKPSVAFASLLSTSSSVCDLNPYELWMERGFRFCTDGNICLCQLSPLWL